MKLCCVGPAGELAAPAGCISGMWQRAAAGPYRARSSTAEAAWEGEVATCVVAAAAVGWIVWQRRHRTMVDGDGRCVGRRSRGGMNSGRLGGPKSCSRAAWKTGWAVERWVMAEAREVL